MSAVKKIVIFGAGRGSRDVLQLIRQINAKSSVWEILGFVDADPELKGKLIDDCLVLGDKYVVPAQETIYGITGVQIPQLRRKIIENEIEGRGLCLANLVHPAIELPADLQMEAGCIIYPGVIIASNVKLGKAVIVNYNTLLGIDLKVGDYAFIGPGVNITASCSIGRECIIGTGAIFMPGVSVGNESIVGLGTKLFISVGDKKSVVDLPRKIMKDINEAPKKVSW
ncbi:MAG: hypothetical protein M0R66_00060 [Candidatus Omnitrophica bacterium]|nr:hypothetical protein [Candidatus Omnitrophota bacterium]